MAARSSTSSCLSATGPISGSPCSTKSPPARSTLSDALNQRDWRIYHALAQRLIVRARALYAQESVLGLDASVYALDATTIDLCLSLFD